MAENRPRNDGRPQPATSGERQPEASERYRAFVENSSEGIWRLEFDPPLDTTLPVDAQVELAYRHGVLIECNDAMARMYGMQRAGDLVGASLDSMLPSSDATARAYLASVIDAGYRVSDVESIERDATGGIKYFSNSMTGISRARPARADVGHPARYHRAEARRAGAARQRSALPVRWATPRR